MRFIYCLIYFLYGCLACFSPGTAFAAEPTHSKGAFPVDIVNQTQIVEPQDIYITIKGTDVRTGDSCFIQFDAQGKGICQAVTDTSDPLSFTYRLSDLMYHDDTASIVLPYLASGRIYLSIGQPVRFQISKQGNKSLVVDPDGFKPRDPNYYTLYDKVEFSYMPPNDQGIGGGSWMNPTAVDFFSLPLSIEQEGSAVFKKTGLSLPRNEILDAVKILFTAQDHTPTHEWKKLFLTYKSRDNDEGILRLMAPGKAMIQGVPGTHPMDQTLLSNAQKFGLNFTDSLWDYYRTHTLGIDTSELRGAGYKLNDYLFIGKVEGDQWVFKNAGDPGNQVAFPKPSRSVPWFAGAVDVFDAANNTPKAIIVRQLTSAFDVGLLPAEDGAILDRAYFDQQREQGKYYTQNPLLPETQTGGPWFDLYSEALHSFGTGQPIYSFAYDDALGQDGTLHDSHPLEISKAVITIGDMSGTYIPRPFQDDRKYTVRVFIGANSTALYEGKALSQGETLSDVSVPMRVTLNGKDAEIYFDPAIVLSKSDQADGIVIENQGRQSMQLIFPGK